MQTIDMHNGIFEWALGSSISSIALVIVIYNWVQMSRTTMGLPTFRMFWARWA